MARHTVRKGEDPLTVFEITQRLNRAHFDQMELLERRFYSPAFITPAEESYAYYTRFPLSTVAALDGDKAVGFVNLFPVIEEVYRALLKGTFNDSGLTFRDILDVSSPGASPVHLFLSCIAVDPAYRKQGAAKALLGAALTAYGDSLSECRDVVTDNVTQEGRRFSERLGFRFVCRSDHGSTVYAMPYPDFVKAVLP